MEVRHYHRCSQAAERSNDQTFYRMPLLISTSHLFFRTTLMPDLGFQDVSECSVDRGFPQENQEPRAKATWWPHCVAGEMLEWLTFPAHCDRYQRMQRCRALRNLPERVEVLVPILTPRSL